ncbi:hypothetical protein [Streptomyces fulvoviolaceus]|uniref:hypothetical protein n=1 Tax=Streptomyces fulvoviolaceus TaxID=285535 RepID=UPI0021BE5DF9|nr:hypothetical protein [Streptomyces fulvoviolaceus]MCT9081946.1 hypothetical protein [Streptomyces fulvoviolaceus]
MFLSRPSASGTRPALRVRLALLVLLLVVAGSPWAQRSVSDYYEQKFFIERADDETLRWFVEAAFTPGWDISSDRYVSTSSLVVNDLSVLVLLVVLVLLTSRLSARGRPGLLRCLAVGVLAAVLANLLWWSLHKFFLDEVFWAPFDSLLTNLLRSGLIFGLAVGVLLAFLTAGLPARSATRSFGAVAAPLRRRKEGGLMTTAPVHMPVGSTPGDVTRYLCAAAYVDEGFADRVVDEVLADEASAVAPSPDVDLVAVVRHSLTAQEIRYQRDLRLTAAFAVVALLAPLWLLFSMMFLGITLRAGSRPSLATRGHRHPESKVLVGTGLAAGLAVLLAFYLGALVSSLPAPGFVSWLLGAYLNGVPAVLASLGAVAFAYVTVVRHDLDIDRLLRTTMTRETFARQPRPTVPKRKWIAERLAAIKEARDGNVTVYSGYTPWVGYSATSSQWPLTVPLLPADDPMGMRQRAAEPRPFTVTELVGHVRDQLHAVAARGATDEAATAAEEALGSLVIEDRVFASGTTIGDDDRFMRSTSLAPAGRLSAEAVEQIMRRPTGAVRHHLAIHVPLWGGDVVPSVFLHFSTVGRTLHLDISNHVLGPVQAAYHVVDRLRGSLTPEAKRGLLMNALPGTGRAFLSAPFRVWRHALFERRHQRRMTDELQAMEQDPVYDYGARLSIREMALSPDYHNYFQVVDADRITSLVQRHTFAAIREFLDSHGYDTTDFRAQQQTILNQGLIQQGGTSIIGNQAIGTGANATQNVPQQSGPAALSATGGSGSSGGSGGSNK